MSADLVDQAPTPTSSRLAFLGAVVSDRRQFLRYALPVVALVLALFVLPIILSSFWVKVFTSAAVTSMVALGATLLFGKVGMVSLSQVGLLSIGVWVSMRLALATSLPFPVLALIAGFVTMIIGVIVGLPALRLSGIYLALVTLFAASGINIIILRLQFPNGGGGFSGVVKDVSTRKEMRRPDIALTDTTYLRYTVIAAALLFLLVVWHLRNKPGRAWASIRQSEAAAVAAGINVTVYKMWAFALSSFVAGVAGALLAGHIKTANPVTFDALQNILLFAVVVLAGAASLWGAVVAGLLKEVVPQFFDKTIGISDRWGLILFGTGVLVNLVLTTRIARKKGVNL